jgi:hypothetical protein
MITFHVYFPFFTVVIQVIYKKKSNNKNHCRKKTHYKPRQDFANQRIRIKGRFVKIDKTKPLPPEIQAAIAAQKAKQEIYKKTPEGKYFY